LRLDIKRSRPVVVGLALLIALVACQGGSTSPTSGAGGPFPVVATTTVLADLVARVGGDRVSVESIVPKGAEVHTFDPSPSDARRVAGARLLVMNGLGLDEWVADLVTEAGSADLPTVRLAEQLAGIEYITGEEHEEADEHEGMASGETPEGNWGEGLNPHLWLNVAYARKYVEKLTAALVAADPANAAAYRANAATYDQRLAELDDFARVQVGVIPEANRKVVSFHEAFPYFAAAYGLEIVGVVVDAPGQDPSAGEIAALIETIRANDVKAIFSEVQFNPDLADRIAAETGATVVADLYNDSLGDPPVDTYEGMIRWDVERVVEALR
jgi:zinc/manganese transport system substrate-binding protein/manganese/iron transport system substrate-binding protein